MGESYLIWSHEHGAWWRADHNGYTPCVDRAGRYTRVEALSICEGANYNLDRRYPPHELMIRERDALDSCDRMKSVKQADPTPSEEASK